MTFIHLSRVARSLLLILIMCIAQVLLGPALAQEQGPAEQAPYATLADVLEDEQARERLIRELRQLAATEEDAAQPHDEVTPSPRGEPLSYVRQIADSTQAFAQNLVAELTSGIAAITQLRSTATDVNLQALARAALDLALIVGVTVAIFLILRRMIQPLFTRANAWAVQKTTGSSLLRRGLAVIGAAVLDLLVILAAWVGGYMLALFVIGDVGSMDTRESLFLNAFLVVEVFKTVIRMVFASRDDGLRMLPIPAEEAAYWNAWLARLSGFIGYSMLVAVPIINFTLSPALGRLASLLIMAIAFLNALIIILQNRSRVAEGLEEQARRAKYGFTCVLLGMLARSWHIIAIGYFAALGIITLVHPEDALPLLLQATLQTLLATGGGVFLSVVLTQVIGSRVRIPEETRRSFPLLEQRLNSFIPTALKVMRLVIMIVVIALVLDAWGLFSLAAWLESEAGTRTTVTAVTVSIILIVSMLLWVALASWIEHRLNPETGGNERSARERTLLAIFRNAVAATLLIITLMIVLAEIGINIGPLIAGAGVLGLAIGFGAQKLVQDIITGVFIQMENGINTGDVVTAGGITGTAEKLTIRSLGIRDLSGTYHMIPFSSVDNVSNYMRDFGYHVGNYGVAYREDTDEVIAKLQDAFDDLVSDPEQRLQVLDELEVDGVTALGDSAVNIRVRIKTLPGVQWAVGRAYNRLVKRHLDAAGIEIPFPHLTVYFGQDKDGTAPAAPIRVQNIEEPVPRPDSALLGHGPAPSGKPGKE